MGAYLVEPLGAGDLYPHPSSAMTLLCGPVCSLLPGSLSNSLAEYAKIHLTALRGLNTGESSELGQSKLNHTSNKHKIIILENIVN